ncbi:MAG: hypothetical protein HZA46_15635 [Planctomycetales bacterium]|nr:hypothetical protein [Planctomycetales bacterium]
MLLQHASASGLGLSDRKFYELLIFAEQFFDEDPALTVWSKKMSESESLVKQEHDN